MSYKHFRWKTDGELGYLTIDVPPMNALSTSVLSELDTVLDDVEKSDVRVFIVTGEGKAFIAGADISEMQGKDETAMAEFAGCGQSVLTRIEQSSKVSIAAVNGFALGGGLEFALACDYRIFSDVAQVGLPEVTLGIIPGFGGTQRLTREIGPGNANRLILTGEFVKADEALRLGIAQIVTTPEELIATAEKSAQKILKNGPLGVAAAKELTYFAVENDLATGLKKEAETFARLFNSDEPAEGMTAFLEKRPAKFK